MDRAWLPATLVVAAVVLGVASGCAPPCEDVVVPLREELDDHHEAQAEAESFCMAPSAEITTVIDPTDTWDARVLVDDGDTLVIWPGAAGGAFIWLGFESRGLSQAVLFDVSMAYDLGWAEPTVVEAEFTVEAERADVESSSQLWYRWQFLTPCALWTYEPTLPDCDLGKLPITDRIEMEVTLTDFSGRSAHVVREVEWEVVADW